METEQTSLAFLVVSGAAVLMLLIALTTRRLEWKRPAPQRVETRPDLGADRHPDQPRPPWTTIVMVSAPCAVGGIAIGVALASAVASPAAVAYVAAALFVAVLVLAAR